MSKPKKRLIVVSLAAVLIAGAAIGLLSRREDTAIASGVYLRQTAEGRLVADPKLIVDGQTFHFVPNALSSYAGIGEYRIEKNSMTAETDDGRYRYVFNMVDGETLELIPGQSTVETFNGKEIIPVSGENVRFILKNQ